MWTTVRRTGQAEGQEFLARCSTNPVKQRQSRSPRGRTENPAQTPQPSCDKRCTNYSQSTRLPKDVRPPDKKREVGKRFEYFIQKIQRWQINKRKTPDTGACD